MNEPLPGWAIDSLASIDLCKLGCMLEATPILRRAARVLLFDESDRVLLARFEQPGKRWWCAPGGGLEGIETHEQATVREVAEETGFAVEELGPWIWTREDVFGSRGRTYHQQERYFPARVPSFVPRPRALGAEESESFRGLRWWRPRELEDAEEVFAPAELPALVRRLLEEGPPERPVRVGVQHCRLMIAISSADLTVHTRRAVRDEVCSVPDLVMNSPDTGWSEPGGTSSSDE